MEQAFGSGDAMEKLETALKKDMFLGGFEATEKDEHAFKALPSEINEKKYPNVARWARFMAHFNKQP